MNSTILAPMRRDAALKAEIRRVQEPPTIEGKTPAVPPDSRTPPVHPGGSIVTQTLSDSAAGEGGCRRNLNSATANETATATESPRFATLHVAAIPAQYTFAHINQAVFGADAGTE